MTHTSAFTSLEAETAYLAAYDEFLSLWPVPYEEIEIAGLFGTTHIVASGPETAPPLVLMHGFMGTLLMWSPNIADLSQDYRVYAVDIMGHPSKSIPEKPIRSAADFMTWITGTLNDLHLDRVHLVGMSFGGWLSLNFSMNAPERINTLVLLSPAACFLPISTQFTLRGILTRTYPKRYWFESLMRWMGLEAAPDNTFMQRMLDLMYMGGMNFQMQETMRVMPTVFSNEELQALKVPVLLLIGEDEVIYDPSAAMDRARQLIPDLAGELVPGCRHEMSMTQHQIVDARVLEFLESN